MLGTEQSIREQKSSATGDSPYSRARLILQQLTTAEQEWRMQRRQLENLLADPQRGIALPAIEAIKSNVAARRSQLQELYAELKAINRQINDRLDAQLEGEAQ